MVNIYTALFATVGFIRLIYTASLFAIVVFIRYIYTAYLYGVITCLNLETVFILCIHI